MYEYRQVLVRMRSGHSDRAIAESGLMGRCKAGKLRKLAREKGWLEKGGALPAAAELARHLERQSTPQTQSKVERFREEVTKLWHKGIDGTTIHKWLCREHRFKGSYSSVRRFVRRLGRRQGEVTVILDFAPGESAQVDFGRGPKLAAPDGTTIATWFFIMTLAWSRHQYAEVVLDQKVETWLSCHRHAFRILWRCTEVGAHR